MGRGLWRCQLSTGEEKVSQATEIMWSKGPEQPGRGVFRCHPSGRRGLMCWSHGESKVGWLEKADGYVLNSGRTRLYEV